MKSGSFCPDNDLRAPPEETSSLKWGGFIETEPTPVLVRKYLIINELQPCLGKNQVIPCRIYPSTSPAPVMK